MKTAQNLFFHYVSAGAPKRRNTVSREALRARIDAERAAGRTPARLDDYLASPPGADRFTISFDDAHASIRDHAAPLVAELGIVAALFVPTAHVETSDEFLTWDDLRALRDAGWIIGSHSHSHVRMTQRHYGEDASAYRDRLVEECARSRALLEEHLGAAPALFAYPYGETNEIAKEAVRAAGYAAAVTVADDDGWEGDHFAIPRVDAAPAAPRRDDPTRFSVVVPAYNRADILAEVVTRLARQSYPEDAHEVIVVDDGSEDDLSPIFRDMPDHIRLVREEGSAFRAGQARNRGAREANNEVLAFLDADVAVPEDYLWHLDWIHRRVDDAVVLGYLSGYNLHDLGFVHTARDARQARQLSALPLIPDRSREPTLRACLDNLDWLEEPWRLTYTGNLSLPRALFERIEGFSDAFVGWGLEDIDLGYRLAKAGGAFVFGRFALGYHLTDANEDQANNPFRRPKPSLADFDGYLENLTILDMRHGRDPAMRSYVDSSRADIEETCGRPYTVGIEMGGRARTRSPHHARVHRVIPGDVTAHELFDRVAYAEKIGARSIYILGGAPAEHPAFFELLARAREVVERVAMLSPVYPFAEEGLAERAKAAGLDAVTCEIHALDEEGYTRVFGEGRWAAFVRGLEALRAADLERCAHVIVSARTVQGFAATLERLADAGIRVDDVTATEPDVADAIASISPVAVKRLQG